MNQAAIHLEAGGVVLAKTKIDVDATEHIVARTYQHPALGNRSVVRLASDRLGKAEDLAMEYLGFNAPEVSPPVGIQQRRSLNFGAWALINDPKNAQYALDLVKQMKAAARQAKSKPGHAWDRYTEMAKELGRSARQFLPPYWEEVGRAYKDLGNQTYAGRALNKSLEAERVHALESDQARRRDVVLEFVLAGCLAGQALSDYGNDLQNHYKPAEAYAIFRDLCTRRTRGGLAPWATMAREFLKMAKAAGEEADAVLEQWLEEIVEAPAMARSPQQFWKSCSAHCKRIVARNPAFAVALLRHTKPEPRYYGESPIWAWLELLESWGVFEFLWKDGHCGAPALGEPIAEWFARIICQMVPVPSRVLEMLVKLTPRLKKEGVPVELVAMRNHSPIDIDVLEGCLSLEIPVATPPANRHYEVSFDGWLASNVDHPLRNQEILKSWEDERFAEPVYKGFCNALRCRGTSAQVRYGQPGVERRGFPLAANDRPGIKNLWRKHTDDSIAALEHAGLASFEHTIADQNETLWPDALRLFPDLADRYNRIDPIDVLQRTLQAGIFDEYGWPGLEQLFETTRLSVQTTYNNRNLFLTYPSLILTDSIHAYVLRAGAEIKKYELRLPAKVALTSAYVVGDDLAIEFRDENYKTRFYWVSNPSQVYDVEGYRYRYGSTTEASTVLPDGSAFFGGDAVRSGDKRLPECEQYLHDGERFWRVKWEFDQVRKDHFWKVFEVDSQTGKVVRESVPAWFERPDGDVVDWRNAQLMPLPAGAEDSPLGSQSGMTGWMPLQRRDGSIHGQGIDGRACTFLNASGIQLIGMLRQPGTDAYWSILDSGHAHNSQAYRLMDPSGTTVIADLRLFNLGYAWGQAAVFPHQYWHFLRVRDEASSKKLRTIKREECASLMEHALADRNEIAEVRAETGDTSQIESGRLLSAVRQMLPTAPERLVIGVIKLVERAMREFNVFHAMREKLIKSVTEGESSKPSLQPDKIEAAASRWGFATHQLEYGKTPDSLMSHLMAVNDFLRGESSPGKFPTTPYDWFSFLGNLRLCCWQTYWKVAAEQLKPSQGRSTEWLEFLKFWQEIGIAILPGRFSLLVGERVDSGRNNDDDDDESADYGNSYSIRNGDDFFIVRRQTGYYTNRPYIILRYTTSASPGDPTGFTITQSHDIDSKYDSDEIVQFIAAVEAAEVPPIPTKEELIGLANQLSLSTAELALTWIGGLNIDTYQSNFLPSELRQLLGLKTTEVSAARQVMKNLNEEVQQRLFKSVISAGLAAPFAGDRAPVLQSLLAAWQDASPQRLPVSAEFQKRLSALSGGNRWNQAKHEELLLVAGDPANHTLLKPKKIRIGVTKEHSYEQLNLTGSENDGDILTGTFLRSIIQLVSLVHTETPIGHAARDAMPSLIARVTKILESPHTMLVISSVYIYSNGKNTPMIASSWINAYLGKTTTDPKTQIALYEDDMFTAGAIDGQHHGLIAFRTAQLKDNNSLSRLRGVEALVPIESYNPHGSAVNSVSICKSIGFQKLAKPIAGSDLEDGQWLQNPLLTAPEVVKQIQSKRKLSEPAAMLYAQLLTLPEPTSANVCKWNNWKSPVYKEAAKQLADRQLVLEATRARAGRPIFLAGEWLDLKAPWLPIESWKLPHLYEIAWDLGAATPMGGPLVLRPFEDLFAAAWQRIIDGDEPRYEEVKRVVKKSKKKS